MSLNQKLVIRLGPTSGKDCSVQLNGQEISGCLKAIEFKAGVGELTEATLHYFGAVEVEMDGSVQLRKQTPTEMLAEAGDHITVSLNGRAVAVGDLPAAVAALETGHPV